MQVTNYNVGWYDLNNDEIRLAILCEFYNALHSDKSYGEVRDINQLKKESPSIIDANVIYLTDKGLIEGEISYTTGGIHPTPSRITAHGMDIVEEIVKRSENEVETEISEKLKEKNITAEKVLKFTELCVKAASMCQTAVNITHGILMGLGS